MLLTIFLVAISTVLLPSWLSITALAIGATLVGVTLLYHRHRIAIEVHMARVLLRTSHRCLDVVDFPDLKANVRAEAMPDGVTRIEAKSWLDAVRALGFVTGRDRAFQLDRLRRMATGRLSEVWGSTALSTDADYRALGFLNVANQALKSLEQEELDLLQAFASGVNAAWNQDGPPFECRFLSYRPEPWVPTDSLLIVLLLFHGLSWNEKSKRAEAVIRRVLPESIARFFLPCDFGADPMLPEHLDHFRSASDLNSDFIEVNPVVAGSNCWVQKGPQGPVLACDLHVPLSMPNLLYEVDLRWSKKRVRGLIATGLPVVLTGNNGQIVWGITNLNADVLDLLPVENGSQESNDLVTDYETIGVRGQADAFLEVIRTGMTRTVSPRSLLGEDVAIRWTGYDARSCDLKFQRLAHATNVDESIALLEPAHGIALNVLVADESGRMVHLATGLLPRRYADSHDVTHGYLTGVERPRLVDPPSGILVSANDAVLPEHPYRIFYDADPGYRARRVQCMLTESCDADPTTMRAMQHDVRAEQYLPYRDLAVSTLQRRNHSILSILAEWDGNADVDSLAFGVLVRLREILVRRVLSPYLTVCRNHDPDFRYAFQSIDRPVFAIIDSGDPRLLPPGEEYDGWEGFMARCVEGAVTDLVRSSGRSNLPTWGQLNRVGLPHSLEELVPWVSPLLSVPERPQAGTIHCVRTCVPGFSAVGRAILRPGAHASSEFETPGGQSGHPLSRHYADRHHFWSSTMPQVPLSNSRGCRYILRATRPQ